MPIDIRFDSRESEQPRDKVPLERARERYLAALLSILVSRAWVQRLAHRIVAFPSLRPGQVGARLLPSSGTCRFYRRKPFHPFVEQFASRIIPRPSLNGRLVPFPRVLPRLFIGLVGGRLLVLVRDYISRGRNS